MYVFIIITIIAEIQAIYAVYSRKLMSKLTHARAEIVRAQIHA